MARDKTDDIQEGPTFEDDANQEGTHDSEMREEENEQNGDISKKGSSPRSLRRRGRRYRWMVFLLVGILLIGAGYVVLHRMGWEIFDKRLHSSESLKIADQDHLQEK